MQQMLVVSDDENVSIPLANLFIATGVDARVADSGGSAIAHVMAAGTDLVLLDLDLPDMDGLEICRTLRTSGFDGGLIILNADHDGLDVVAGLDAGADDYLAKPYSLAELQSRVRCVLRRMSWHYEPQPVATDSGLQNDEAAHRISYCGVEITSSGREYEVLSLLIANNDRTLTRRELLDRVWGKDWAGSDAVLSMAIARIRERLRIVGAPDRVENVRGIGFRLSSLGNSEWSP